MTEATAALAVVKHDAGTLMRQATDVAGVCAEIVKRTAQNIQGRKYVKVEGWQSIAAAYGCLASSLAVEKVAGGFRAVGEVRRMSDGAVLATAEGFVGEDETTWFGGKDKYGKEQPARPEYAVRAMAQTRAISRACRSAFAFVVTMIDGELSTTPAEEMDGLDVTPRPAAQQTVNAAPKSAPRPTSNAAPRPAQAPSGGSGAVFGNFGRSKGLPVFGASANDLSFYASSCERSLADPSKERFHAKERALLEAIREEQRRQGGNSAEAYPDEPPPPGDNDAPGEPF